MPTGTNQTLKVTLTPASSNYATVSATVLITVTPGPLRTCPRTASTLARPTWEQRFANRYCLNVGTASMTINNPTISAIAGGSANEFSLTNSCPKSLAAGKSCNVTVTFTAGAFLHPAQTADLNINDNSVGAPQTIPMYAQVIDPVAKISTGSLSFGTVKVGTSSAAQAVTLLNTGATPLTGSISLSGTNPGDFSETIIAQLRSPLMPTARLK